MDNSVSHSHSPALDMIIFLSATVTGAIGDLAEIDLFMSIILKIVSIASFLLLIVINWNKVIGIIKGRKSKNKSK
jgi:hypothetical protein